MIEVTRQFPSDLRQLAAVRLLVRDVCSRAWGPGAAQERVVQLELAVNEAVTNVIRHAYEGKEDESFEVAVTGSPGHVSVQVLHRGLPFDPTAVPPPSFDGSREGGFGLYIIRQAVDELEYFQDEAGRQGVRLVKRNECPSARDGPGEST